VDLGVHLPELSLGDERKTASVGGPNRDVSAVYLGDTAAVGAPQVGYEDQPIAAEISFALIVTDRCQELGPLIDHRVAAGLTDAAIYPA
jgi:hypothetical protein